MIIYFSLLIFFLLNFRKQLIAPQSPLPWGSVKYQCLILWFCCLGV